MPRRAIGADATTAAHLAALGGAIRARREALRVSAATTAQAAGISRVTLHRIEQGLPSVAAGAYVAVIASLGLELALIDPNLETHDEDLPARIVVAEYPELAKLAWQRAEDAVVSPAEALALYERNWRHVDVERMTDNERKLVDRLTDALGKGRRLV